MDPKASAKSKRSYSLHGRRAHHHPPPPSTSSHKKKTTVGDAQQQQQRARPPKPSLPSNWDRYESEEDEEEPTITSAAAAADPKPKSKGADFSYLLEQARDAARTPPSFDDAVPEFISGLSPFALERGKKLLLSCGDDDFFVDDQVTSTFEVPFLSLDLDALGSQLEKLKLSQRLFIDAKYLQEELATEELDESVPVEVVHKESPEHSESNSSVESRHIIEEPKTAETKLFMPVIDKQFMAPETAGAGLSKAASSFVETESRSIFNSTEDHVLSVESCPSVLSSMPQTTAGSAKDRSGVFEASTAEAELDMLLDSLSEINLPSSSATEKLSCDPPRPSGGYKSSASVGFSRLREDMDSSTLSVSASEKLVLGNRILESETPNSYSKGSRFASGDGVPTGHAPPTSFLNDSIDDLLMQVSAKASNHQSSSSKQEVGKQTLNISRALDDLDSLLDGL